MRCISPFVQCAASLLLWLSSVQPVVAQSTPEIVSRGKQATAMVVAESRRVSGTAFCIDPVGYFVTNAHVAGKPGDIIKLILLPGESDERILSARVVRVDDKADLALLHCDAAANFTKVDLGNDSDLFETQQVTVFGYPLGTALALRKQDYPGITVSVGRISAVRRTNNTPAAIQLDAIINPGNSGGPVLNDAGEVIGVVVARIGDTGLNLAIPVSQLHSFLSRPDVEFTPPSILLSRRHEPVELAVRVTSFDGKQRDLTVKVDWSSHAEDQRELTLESSDGSLFKTEVIPVPRRDGANELDVVARFDRGAIQGMVPDTTITLDDHETPLRDVRRLTRTADGYSAKRFSGEQLTGSHVAGLPGDIRIGDQTIPVDLGKATELWIAAPADGVGAIQYSVVVLEGTTELLRTSGRIVLQNNVVLPDIAGAQLLPLGGESPYPAFLEPSPDALYEPQGLRTKDRNYVRTRSRSLLTGDFSVEIEFELESRETDEWGNVAFIGIGTVEQAAYDEPKNCAYLRISPLHVSGTAGLSNRPVDQGTEIGEFRTTGPHRARIRRKGELVIFEVDVDSDGPSPDDFSRTIPDIRAFVPVLHEKNTQFFFGGAALFKKISFEQQPAATP